MQEHEIIEIAELDADCDFSSSVEDGAMSKRCSIKKVSERLSASRSAERVKFAEDRKCYIDAYCERYKVLFDCWLEERRRHTQ